MVARCAGPFPCSIRFGGNCVPAALQASATWRFYAFSNNKKVSRLHYQVSLPEWLMGVDLRSTAGNCAWARTPQLTFSTVNSRPAVPLLHRSTPLTESFSSIVMRRYHEACSCSPLEAATSLGKARCWPIMSAAGFEPARSCLQWILSPPP